MADIDGSCDSLAGRVSANIKETETPQLIIRRSQRNNAKAANASSDKRPKLARAWPTRGGDVDNASSDKETRGGDDQDHDHADGHDGHPDNSSGPSLDPPEGVDYGANNLEEVDDKHIFIGPKAHWYQGDYELWKSVRVKLDAVHHTMMRFERALRKKHGAYAHFMSRLRDAIFMINNDDVAALKQVLKARWFKRRARRNPSVPDDELRAAVDKDVEQRFLENYAWFAHKVRRHIPEPKTLEKNLRDLADTFATVPDAKTEAQLFTPKTWSVFTETIAHVRKGCLSDRADMNYYYTTGTTAEGFPIYKFTRGTSALEGYHHHLRMLFAQGCNSPRLAISLLRCFNYRWNIERRFDDEDLPKFYIVGGTVSGMSKKCKMPQRIGMTNLCMATGFRLKSSFQPARNFT